MRRLPVLPADVPTASKVGLAMRCLYPWTSAERPTSQPPGQDSLVGTVTHAGADAAIRGEDTAPDMRALTAESQERAWDLIEVVRGFISEERQEPHLLYEAEKPVEIDLLTGSGRALPSKGQRDYSARSLYGFVGTADHLLWPEGGRLAVRDWKTGGQRGLAQEAARMQVRTLAVAAAAIYEVDEVVTEVASVETDGVHTERETLTSATLDEHFDALWALAVRLGSGPRPPTPGPWCVEMHCHFLDHCPASRGALAAVSNEQPVVRIEDDATALRAIEFLPRAEAALKAIQDALDAYIRTSPPTGPDGRRYGIVDQETRRLDISTPNRRAALAKVLGNYADVAIESKYSTSMRAIERAARRKLAAEGKHRGIGAIRDEVIAALDDVGGVRTTTYAKKAWFRPEGQPGEGTQDLPIATEGYDYE